MFEAKIIKEIRQRRGLTQTELSTKVGVSLKTVGRWENGESTPDANELNAIATALGVHEAFFFKEKEKIDAMKANVDMSTKRYPKETINLRVYDMRVCAGFGWSHEYADTTEPIRELEADRALVGAISPDEDKRPFMVRVDGDSMSEANIHDGAEVIINPAMDVYSGDAALVCFGKNKEAAIKWVYFMPDGAIELHSATPGFPIYRFTQEQQLSEDAPLIIVGKVMFSGGVPLRG